MRALTVHPPWSHAIARLGKDVECRGWMTYYRGELAIHASAVWSFDGETDPRVGQAWRRAGAGSLSRHNPVVDRSAVVAVARLADVHRNRGCCEPWGTRPGMPVTLAYRWHWVLRDVQPLGTPVSCPGRQGLWTLPVGVARQVRDALAVRS